MFDNERITHIIGDIEKYFTDLKEMEIKELDDLEDKKNFYSVSMILFSILNRAIDLGEEIVAGKKLGVPSTYKEIFKLLMQNKNIDKGMEKELSELVFYRNQRVQYFWKDSNIIYFVFLKDRIAVLNCFFFLIFIEIFV